MLCQQAHSPDEAQAESDTSKEGGQTEPGAQPKKKGLFKRGWGTKNKSADEKQVKASKSKLGHSTAALEHKSAGSFPLTCVACCQAMLILLGRKVMSTGMQTYKDVSVESCHKEHVPQTGSPQTVCSPHMLTLLALLVSRSSLVSVRPVCLGPQAIAVVKWKSTLQLSHSTSIVLCMQHS